MEELNIEEVRLTPQSRTEIKETVIVEETLDPFQQINLFPRTAKIPDRLLRAFLNLSVTPPSLQLLEHLFQDGRMEPVEGLIEYSLRIRDEWDLYAIALCLRYGANPNVYVISTRPIEGIADNEFVHLVAALFLTHNIFAKDKLKDKSLLVRLLTLLRLYGVDIRNPLFNSGSFEETKSVEDWLGDAQALYTNIPDTLAKVDVGDRFYYAALTGQIEEFFTLQSVHLKIPSLKTNTKSIAIEEEVSTYKISESEYAFLVRSRTYNVFQGRLSLQKVITVVEVDSILPILALQYYNEQALLDYVRSIALISYPLTNEVCIRCQGSGLLSRIWAQTLVACVRYGLPLDLWQYKLVEENEIIRAELTKEYNVPYWRKFLRQPKERGLLPVRIYDLAVAICGTHFDAHLPFLKEAIVAVEKQIHEAKTRSQETKWNTGPDQSKTRSQERGLSENSSKTNQSIKESSARKRSNKHHESLEESITRRERLKILANKGCLVGRSYEPNQDVELVVVSTETQVVENPFLLLNEYRILFNHKDVLYVIYSFDYPHLHEIPELKELPQFAQFQVLDKRDRNLAIIQSKGGDINKVRTYLDVIEEGLTADRITNAVSEAQLAQLFVSLGGYLPLLTDINTVYNGIYNLQELNPEHTRVTLAYLYNDLRSENIHLWEKLHKNLQHALHLEQ